MARKFLFGKIREKLFAFLYDSPIHTYAIGLADRQTHSIALDADRVVTKIPNCLQLLRKSTEILLL